MKKILSLVALLVGLSLPLFAGTGGANDDYLFILVMLSFLLLIAGVLKTIDYLKKNGRTMLRRAVCFLKDQLNLLKDYLNKGKAAFLELSND